MSGLSCVTVQAGLYGALKETLRLGATLERQLAAAILIEMLNGAQARAYCILSIACSSDATKSCLQPTPLLPY